MHDPLHLAELVCTQLCHDLSGPVGSLMGASEIAAAEAGGSEASKLTADAAVLLGRRLRILRAAWAGDVGPMNVPELREFAVGAVAGRRVEVELSGLDPSSVFSPGGARVLLNVLLLAVEGLAGSGRLAVGGSTGGDVVVTIDGPRAAWPGGFVTCLADEKPPGTRWRRRGRCRRR